jgi:predicted DNA-binding protein with PD1-like motif
VTLGYFDRRKRAYCDTEVSEQVEVLALVGNIARSSDMTRDGLQPKLHAHVVVSRADASTLGGHLRRARVWPTLEVIVVENKKYLQRALDPETGLALIVITDAEEAPPLAATATRKE